MITSSWQFLQSIIAYGIPTPSLRFFPFHILPPRQLAAILRVEGALSPALEKRR
jgi:hypothetical protein